MSFKMRSLGRAAADLVTLQHITLLSLKESVRRGDFASRALDSTSIPDIFTIGQATVLVFTNEVEATV
ncbi:unnamed protein product, partial [Dicrocoelium dendriticum]